MKIYHCNGLTGGAARNLDGISVDDLVNGARAIVFTDENEAIFFEFQATATDAEQAAFHPYKIRPDDYSSQGVWYEQEVWDMDTPGINLLTNSGFGLWSNGTVADYSDPNTGFSKLHPTACCTDPDDDQDNTTGWNASKATLTSEAGGVTGNRLKVAATGVEGAALEASQNSLTQGKLYHLKGKAGADIGDNYRVELHSATYGYVYQSGSIAGQGAGTWDTYDLIIECPSTQTDWKIILRAVANTDNAYFDNFSLSECVPACVAVNDVGPDGWTKGGPTHPDLYREQEGRNGFFYALKICAKGTNSWVYWPETSVLTTTRQFMQKFEGRTVTFGAWVKSNTANSARLEINYSGLIQAYSSYHSGGSSWEWMEVTKEIPSTITTSLSFTVSCLGVAGTEVAYVCQPMLIFGNSIGDGNYIQPPGETLWLESPITLTDYNAATVSANASIKLEEQSSGKIPKGAKAVYCELMGQCANADKYVALLAESGGSQGPRIEDTVVANKNHTVVGWCPCDANGDIYIERDDTFTVTIKVLGVEIR